ncbi:hypothetical protein [Caballeronia sp. LZ035]|uniref:hypothetical protein n=1 Tax=Caballeronia sp. LZ035 TaxID=3038568 RepID=UPI002866B3AA|nr:hypothetical protein [Caballeronia sp. LZ035]MDR5755616.1 hypothetical protein [Caballeronia sp. LZ035]
MKYFHGPLEARQFYESVKGAAEITVAASFGAPFDGGNVAHCAAFIRSLDALLADDERMQFHGWTASELIWFACGGPRRV